MVRRMLLRLAQAEGIQSLWDKSSVLLPAVEQHLSYHRTVKLSAKRLVVQLLYALSDQLFIRQQVE